MLIGAWSAALLGLAAPATAVEPIAQPASPGAANGSAEDVSTVEAMDATAGANGRVVIMTLSKRRPEPEPRTASSPGELGKRALSGRPPRKSD
jgi:hypothetical protein